MDEESFVALENPKWISQFYSEIEVAVLALRAQ